MIKVMHTDYGGDDTYLLMTGGNIRVMEFSQLFNILCSPHRATYVVKEVTEEVMDEMPPTIELDFCEMYDHVVVEKGDPGIYFSTYNAIWNWLEGADD